MLRVSRRANDSALASSRPASFQRALARRAPSSRAQFDSRNARSATSIAIRASSRDPTATCASGMFEAGSRSVRRSPFVPGISLPPTKRSNGVSRVVAMVSVRASPDS